MVIPGKQTAQFPLLLGRQFFPTKIAVNPLCRQRSNTLFQPSQLSYGSTILLQSHTPVPHFQNDIFHRDIRRQIPFFLFKFIYLKTMKKNTMKQHMQIHSCHRFWILPITFQHMNRIVTADISIQCKTVQPPSFPAFQLRKCQLEKSKMHKNIVSGKPHDLPGKGGNFLSI